MSSRFITKIFNDGEAKAEKEENDSIDAKLNKLIDDYYNFSRNYNKTIERYNHSKLVGFHINNLMIKLYFLLELNNSKDVDYMLETKYNWENTNDINTLLASVLNDYKLTDHSLPNINHYKKGLILRLGLEKVESNLEKTENFFDTLKKIIDLYLNQFTELNKKDNSYQFKKKITSDFSKILKLLKELLEELKQISTTDGGFKIKRIRVIRKY